MNKFLWISHINVIEVFNNSIILTALKWKIIRPLGSNFWPFNLQAPDSFWASCLSTKLLPTSLWPWHDSFQKSGLQVFVELHRLPEYKQPCVCVCVCVCVVLLTLSECFSESVAVNATGAGERAYRRPDAGASSPPFLGVSSYGHVVRNIYIL